MNNKYHTPGKELWELTLVIAAITNLDVYAVYKIDAVRKQASDSRYKSSPLWEIAEESCLF